MTHYIWPDFPIYWYTGMSFLLFLFTWNLTWADCDRPALTSVLRRLDGNLRSETWHDSNRNEMISIHVAGERVATLVYRVMRDNSISIDTAETTSAFRGQGGFTRLFEEMLRREPQITEIESTLMKDNFKIAKENDPGPSILEHERCVRMAMATPAYRTRARYGFTRITECSLMPFGIILRVAR